LIRKRPCHLSEVPAAEDVVVLGAVLPEEAIGRQTEILLDRGRMATDHREARAGLVVVPAVASDPRQNL